MLPLLSHAQARRLFLGASAMLEDPARRATPASLLALIERLGFVQVDSIHVLERAHHLTLRSRLDGYTHEMLRQLLEEQRRLFEHWTHDASIVPVRWFAHWKLRFLRDRERMRSNRWWQHHLGDGGEQVVAAVRARIAQEGPLRSADFEHAGKRESWWGWKPQKAALDFLWRSGELMVPRRERFQKLYDLTERVHPREHAAPAPSSGEHLDWACRTAAERLALFTPRELSQFWNAIDLAAARAWCGREAKAGALEEVRVESADGSIAKAFALAGWRARLASLPDAPARTRLLCPFDPILRDRERARRRFGFDYRLEVFIPERQRTHGYFVLPILEGEQLIGRLDPKLHRAAGVLEIRGLWWEPGVRPTKARLRGLRDELERLARFVGARAIEMPKANSPSGAAALRARAARPSRAGATSKRPARSSPRSRRGG